MHLRDGSELEVDLPPAEMRAFTAWLSERNPDMRWGAYDNSALSAGNEDDVQPSAGA